MVMLVSVMILGCENGLNNQNDASAVSIDSLIAQLDQNNYTMIYDTDSESGTMTMLRRLDQNSYYQMSDWGSTKMEVYVLEEDGTLFAYTMQPQSAVWRKMHYHDNEDTWLFDTIYAQISIDQSWLEAVSEGVYHLKEDHFEDVFEDRAYQFESMIFTLTEDSITATATGTAETEINTFVFAFTDIGTTVIGFPEGEIEDLTTD